MNQSQARESNKRRVMGIEEGNNASINKYDNKQLTKLHR